MIRVPGESFSVAIESRNGPAPVAPQQGCQHPRPASLGTVGRVGDFAPLRRDRGVCSRSAPRWAGCGRAPRHDAFTRIPYDRCLGTPHRRWRAAPPRQPVAAAVSFDRFDLRGGGVAPGSGAVFRATRRTWGPTVGETLAAIPAAVPFGMGSPSIRRTRPLDGDAGGKHRAVRRPLEPLPDEGTTGGKIGREGDVGSGPEVTKEKPFVDGRVEKVLTVRRKGSGVDEVGGAGGRRVVLGPDQLQAPGGGDHRDDGRFEEGRRLEVDDQQVAPCRSPGQEEAVRGWRRRGRSRY